MRLQFRRSPPFGRLDLPFVSSFVLQHPVMADDDVDDALPVSRRLRDLRRQDVDTITVCPGMTREDVSILHAIARSRTTSIDEVDVIGPRLYSRRETVLFFSRRVSPMSTKTVGSVPSLPVNRPHLPVATMILRPIDLLSTHATATTSPHRVQLPRFWPAYYY